MPNTITTYEITPVSVSASSIADIPSGKFRFDATTASNKKFLAVDDLSVSSDSINRKAIHCFFKRGQKPQERSLTAFVFKRFVDLNQIINFKS